MGRFLVFVLVGLTSAIVSATDFRCIEIADDGSRVRQPMILTLMNVSGSELSEGIGTPYDVELGQYQNGEYTILLTEQMLGYLEDVTFLFNTYYVEPDSEYSYIGGGIYLDEMDQSWFGWGDQEYRFTCEYL